MQYTITPDFGSESTKVKNEVNESSSIVDQHTFTLNPSNQNPRVVEVEIDGVKRKVFTKVDSNGTVSFSLNGYTYALKVEQAKHEKVLQLLRTSDAAKNAVTKVAAPMPGLIKSCLVQEEQSVKKGETMFILEAMKMENAIKSPSAGIVRKLQSLEGSAVEKGTLLCILEPIAL